MDKEESGIIRHAKYELNLLLKTCGEESMAHQQELNKKVLDLIEVFSGQDHSGFSAGMAIGSFKRNARKSKDEVWKAFDEVMSECKPGDESEMQGLFNKDVKELLDVFYSQNNSEEDALAIIDMFAALADFKTVAPLTGEDGEWGEPCTYNGLRQNKRCSAVFKDGNGVCTYIYKYVFSDNGGHSWFTSTYAEKALGLDRSISFPYVPKSEYIYVKENPEDGPDFINITGDKEEIERLSKEFKARFA